MRKSLKFTLVICSIALFFTGCSGSSGTARQDGPSVATAATGVTETSAVLNGYFAISAGDTVTYWFEYGPTPGYGVTTSSFTISYAGAQSIPAQYYISGLADNTLYHFRLVVQNSAGIFYSPDLTFTTLKASVNPVAAPATAVTEKSATLHGSFSNPSGYATTVWFEYGPTLSYGASSASIAYLSAGSQSISSTVSGLTDGSLYHFRLVAQNADGIFYSPDRSFSTLKAPINLATGLSSPTGIAVDSNYVYWTEYGAVKKVGKDGGTVTTLASGLSNSNPYSIAVDSTDVYWTENVSNGAVRKVNINGGTVTTLASGLNHPFGIFINSSDVYWTEHVSLSGTVSRVSKSGGAVTVLVSGVDNPWAVAVDSESVYWSEGDSMDANGNINANGAVKKIGINGGTVSVLASTYEAGSIALDTSNVYWTEAFNIRKLNKSGGAIITLASNIEAYGPHAIGFAVDGSDVYWTDSKSWMTDLTPSLLKVGINGGAPAVVRPGRTTGIALDSLYIYLSDSNNGTITKIPK